MKEIKLPKLLITSQVKIYTKKGDKGETSLIGGVRVKKSNVRIHAYGTVDELNSMAGLVRDTNDNEEIKKQLLEIQDRLFTLGSLLASAAGSKMKLPEIKKEDILSLEDRKNQAKHKEDLFNILVKPEEG